MIQDIQSSACNKHSHACANFRLVKCNHLGRTLNLPLKQFNQCIKFFMMLYKTDRISAMNAIHNMVHMYVQLQAHSNSKNQQNKWYLLMLLRQLKI